MFKGKSLYFFFIGFAVLLFSLDILPLLSIKDQTPDLILVFLVFLAQKRGVMRGQVIGFLFGLFIDFFSGQLLGSQAFIKMSMGFLVGLINNRFIVYTLQTQILLVFMASSTQAILFFLVQYFFGHISAGLYFSTIWIEVLYTTAVSPLLILILNFIDRKSIERF